MNISVATELPPGKGKSCLIIAVPASGKLGPSASAIDKASGGYLKKLQKRGDINTKSGQCKVLFDLEGTDYERILVVGCGNPKTLTRTGYLKLLKAAFRAARATPAEVLVTTLTEVSVLSTEEGETGIGENAKDIARWKVLQEARAVEETGYRFSGHDKLGEAGDKKKSSSSNQKKPLKRVVLVQQTLATSAASTAAKAGQAVARGMHTARDLGNLAPNVCTPSYLATQARSMAKNSDKLKVTVLGEKQLEKLGMGAFLAVSSGSRQEGKLIIMEYRGGPKTQRPVVLVGKGITFDTGGISIKPSATMDEMKFDMCGAASVFGALTACLDMGLKRNVVFAVAAAENMPDGLAARPGDVVSTMAGKSVEILNTDAEGRLVLCDTLTYVQRFKPEAIVDVATLTGACVVALGGVATGLMSNSEKLAGKLLKAGADSGDKVWQLPLFEEYRPQLDSNFADLANIGGRHAGAITAGVFLGEFVGDCEWAHLDIAGTAWASGAAKGASGRPVPLLMQYLMADG